MLKPRFIDEQNATKVNLTSLAYSYSKSKPEIRSLLEFSEIRKIVKELKNDNNLISAKSDKGNGCVLMNKSDYLEKVYVVIDDSSKFKLLDSAKELNNIDKVKLLSF